MRSSIVFDAVPEQTVELPQGTIAYRDVGPGGDDAPVLLFVHGLLVDALLWQHVVPLLADRFRCVAPTLPLGAHRTPARPDADLSPDGHAQLLVDLIAALGLRDVVLVGNDTGGALCQLVVARHPELVAGLVLTNCDAFEQFPPTLLAPLRLVRTGRAARAVGRSMRLRLVRRVVVGAVSRSYEPATAERWLRRLGDDPGVAHDTAKLLAGLRPDGLTAHVDALRAYDRPVLLVWGQGDRWFFPPRLGERLAGLFPNSRLVTAPRARAFVPLDAPELLATAVADFDRARRGG